MPKKGFTLVEVMVAMILMCVLASILTPTIMRLRPNNNNVMFKKAFFTLEKNINLLINDNINYPASQTRTISGEVIQRGFNYTVATTNGGVNKFCYLLADSLSTIGAVNCPLVSEGGLPNMGTFTTSDGVVWHIYFTVPDTTTNTNISNDAYAVDGSFVQFPLNKTLFETRILIDVNGDKEPNCTLDTTGNSFTPYPRGSASGTFNYLPTCKKPDRFIIGVRYDGKLRVGMSNYGNNTVTDAYAIGLLDNPTSSD